MAERDRGHKLLAEDVLREISCDASQIGENSGRMNAVDTRPVSSRLNSSRLSAILHLMEDSFDDGEVQLAEFAALLRERNSIDARIGVILNRPATVGNIGEWIAAKVFDIGLTAAANNAAFDGHFHTGPLTGRTVNIKAYGRQESLLDVTKSPTLDYYLVLTGPKGAPSSSRGTLRPFCIESVYLFDSQRLLVELEETGVKVGVATSVRAALWNAAEIYPHSANSALTLTDRQRAQLAMFCCEWHATREGGPST